MPDVPKEEIQVTNTNGRRPSSEGDHDPHFEPIISLPEVKVPTLEEEETVLFKVRAKLFRHDRVNKEWKERGTGEAKLLFHETRKTVRIIMRRDKTLKLCANHYVTKDMKLEAKSGSDRVWLWTTGADMSDGFPEAEILAMRFMNPEAANSWRSAFEDAKKLIPESYYVEVEETSDDDEGVSSPSDSENESEDEVLEKVGNLSIKDEATKEESSEEGKDVGDKNKDD